MERLLISTLRSRSHQSNNTIYSRQWYFYPIFISAVNFRSDSWKDRVDSFFIFQCIKPCKGSFPCIHVVFFTGLEFYFGHFGWWQAKPFPFLTNLSNLVFGDRVQCTLSAARISPLKDWATLMALHDASVFRSTQALRSICLDHDPLKHSRSPHRHRCTRILFAFKYWGRSCAPHGEND